MKTRLYTVFHPIYILSLMLKSSEEFISVPSPFAHNRQLKFLNTTSTLRESHENHTNPLHNRYADYGFGRISNTS